MECKCPKCVNCCKHIQGIPKPDDIKKIAKHLNLPLKETLKRYFIVGWRKGIVIAGKEYNIDFVYPAREGFNDTVEDFGYPFDKGKCLFLKNDLCIIHKIKPFECWYIFGCEKESKRFMIDGFSEIPRNVALLEWHKERNNLPKEIKEFIKR